MKLTSEGQQAFDALKNIFTVKDRPRLTDYGADFVDKVKKENTVSPVQWQEPEMNDYLRAGKKFAERAKGSYQDIVEGMNNELNLLRATFGFATSGVRNTVKVAQAAGKIASDIKEKMTASANEGVEKVKENTEPLPSPTVKAAEPTEIPSPIEKQMKKQTIETSQVLGVETGDEITPTPQPETRPKLSAEQEKNRLETRQKAEELGANPDVLEAIHFNEGSLSREGGVNITENEESYGPFQINFKICDKSGNCKTLDNRDGLTRDDAKNYDAAVEWAANRLQHAEKLYPDDIENQLLYYNVPGNAGKRPKDLTFQALWYVANGLKFIGKEPTKQMKKELIKNKLWSE